MAVARTVRDLMSTEVTTLETNDKLVIVDDRQMVNLAVVHQLERFTRDTIGRDRHRIAGHVVIDQHAGDVGHFLEGSAQVAARAPA